MHPLPLGKSVLVLVSFNPHSPLDHSSICKRQQDHTHPSKAHMLKLQRQRHPCQVRKISEQVHEKRRWMNNRICWDQQLFSISSFTTSCITVSAPIAPLPLLHVLLRKEICTTKKIRKIMIGTDLNIKPVTCGLPAKQSQPSAVKLVEIHVGINISETKKYSFFFLGKKSHGTHMFDEVFPYI